MAGIHRTILLTLDQKFPRTSYQTHRICKGVLQGPVVTSHFMLHSVGPSPKVGRRRACRHARVVARGPRDPARGLQQRLRERRRFQEHEHDLRRFVIGIVHRLRELPQEPRRDVHRPRIRTGRGLAALEQQHDRTTLSPSERTAFEKASAACASLRPKFTGPASGAGSTAFAAYRNCLKLHGVTLPAGRGGWFRWGRYLDLHHHHPEAEAAEAACAALRPKGGFGAVPRLAPPPRRADERRLPGERSSQPGSRPVTSKEIGTPCHFCARPPTACGWAATPS